MPHPIRTNNQLFQTPIVQHAYLNLTTQPTFAPLTFQPPAMVFFEEAIGPWDPNNGLPFPLPSRAEVGTTDQLTWARRLVALIEAMSIATAVGEWPHAILAAEMDASTRTVVSKVKGWQVEGSLWSYDKQGAHTFYAHNVWTLIQDSCLVLRQFLSLLSWWWRASILGGGWPQRYIHQIFTKHFLDRQV